MIYITACQMTGGEFAVKVKKLAFESNINRFYVTFKPTMGPGGTPGGMQHTAVCRKRENKLWFNKSINGIQNLNHADGDSDVVSKVRTKRHFSTEIITDKEDICINRKVTFVPWIFKACKP